MELRPFYVLGVYENDKIIEYVDVEYSTLELAKRGYLQFKSMYKTKGRKLKILKVHLSIN